MLVLVFNAFLFVGLFISNTNGFKDLCVCVCVIHWETYIYKA